MLYIYIAMQGLNLGRSFLLGIGAERVLLLDYTVHVSVDKM